MSKRAKHRANIHPLKAYWFTIKRGWLAFKDLVDESE